MHASPPQSPIVRTAQPVTARGVLTDLIGMTKLALVGKYALALLNSGIINLVIDLVHPLSVWQSTDVKTNVYTSIMYSRTALCG